LLEQNIKLSRVTGITYSVDNITTSTVVGVKVLAPWKSTLPN